MQIFKNRPLALLGVLVAVSAVLATNLPLAWRPVLLACTLLLSFLFTFLIWKKAFRKKSSFYLLAALIGICLGLISSCLYFDFYYRKIEQDVGRELEIEGTVLSRISSTAFSSTFEVRLDQVDGEGSFEKIVLECAYPSALQSGDRFSAVVTQREFTMFGDYDEERSYLADGFTRALTCDSTERCFIRNEKSHSVEVLLRQWNMKLSRHLHDMVGGEEGRLAVALLLGNKSFLSSDVSLDFRRAGISHMLALSGMHVAIIIAFVDFLLRRLQIAKMIRAIVVPSTLLGYLFLTGMSPSTVRAVLMMCILYLGVLLRADYDSFTALAAVLAAILLITPYAVYDLSLWMSFLAASSIIIFAPPIRMIGARIKGIDGGRMRKALAGLTESVLVGIIANAALLLLSASVFGEISVASVPATVLLAVPMSGLLITALLSLLLFGAQFFVLPCRILSHLMLLSANWISNLDGILFSVRSDIEHFFLIVFTGALVLLAVLRIKRIAWLSVVPVFMVLLFVLSATLTASSPRRYDAPIDGFREFHALSVSGEMVAVAVGDAYAEEAMELADYASEMRCTEIGDLFLSRYINRQTYFISELSARIRVRRLHLPTPQGERECAIAARIEEEARLHGIEVFYNAENLCVPNAGDPYAWIGS